MMNKSSRRNTTTKNKNNQETNRQHQKLLHHNYEVFGAVVVFAKCPIPGSSKTRLSVLVGDTKSSQLAGAMLSDVLLSISHDVQSQLRKMDTEAKVETATTGRGLGGGNVTAKKKKIILKFLVYAPADGHGQGIMKNLLTDLGLRFEVETSASSSASSSTAGKDRDTSIADQDDCWHLLPMLSSTTSFTPVSAPVSVPIHENGVNKNITNSSVNKGHHNAISSSTKSNLISSDLGSKLADALIRVREKIAQIVLERQHLQQRPQRERGQQPRERGGQSNDHHGNDNTTSINSIKNHIRNTVMKKNDEDTPNSNTASDNCSSRSNSSNGIKITDLALDVPILFLGMDAPEIPSQEIIHAFQLCRQRPRQQTKPQPPQLLSSNQLNFNTTTINYNTISQQQQQQRQQNNKSKMEVGKAYLNPANDGGYCMLCVPSHAPPHIFEGVRWSSSLTAVSQLKALTDCGLGVIIGSLMNDIDEPEDLMNLAVRLCMLHSSYSNSPPILNQLTNNNTNTPGSSKERGTSRGSGGGEHAKIGLSSTASSSSLSSPSPSPSNNCLDRLSRLSDICVENMKKEDNLKVCLPNSKGICPKTFDTMIQLGLVRKKQRTAGTRYSVEINKFQVQEL